LYRCALPGKDTAKQLFPIVYETGDYKYFVRVLSRMGKKKSEKFPKKIRDAKFTCASRYILEVANAGS
jgi:hypothetical protein